MIDEILLFLSGKEDKLVGVLEEEKMKAASMAPRSSKRGGFIQG